LDQALAVEKASIGFTSRPTTGGFFASSGIAPSIRAIPTIQFAVTYLGWSGARASSFSTQSARLA
jgi:hypothetical protein